MSIDSSLGNQSPQKAVSLVSPRLFALGVRDGLAGDAYFIDTIYGGYMTAMILFQSQPRFANLGKSEVVEDAQIKSLHEFQQQNPDAWHSALEAITQSTINHIRHTKNIGASGALVSIFNAESKFGSVGDYERYTRAPIQAPKTAKPQSSNPRVHFRIDRDPPGIQKTDILQSAAWIVR